MGGVETWLVEILRKSKRDGKKLPEFDFILTGGTLGFFDEEVL